MKNVIRERMGSAPTPVCMACETALCSAAACLKRSDESEIRGATASLVNAPRYASPSVTDSPICVVSSTVPLVGLPRFRFWQAQGATLCSSFSQISKIFSNVESCRFPNRSIQAEQDEREPTSRDALRPPQRGHAGAVDVPNGPQV